MPETTQHGAVTMDFLDVFNVSASGLTAQRVRLQAVASNMANARSTRTEAGGPYQRKLAVFEAQEGGFGDALEQALTTVQVTEVVASDEPPVLHYDPGHPDADEQGYVAYPNVNILEEMVDMMTTSRAYEANTNVVSTTRTMADSALRIGR
jgi:flagellar basal-body rod protein FlgC